MARGTAYFALKRDAAAGIDGETWTHYGDTLEDNLRDLAARFTRGAFRASPVRRAYIPKADGRQRPLGVPTLEDKLVQLAVVDVLLERHLRSGLSRLLVRVPADA